MKKAKWVRNKQAIIELHGDQLYFWFRQYFRGHPKAMKQNECRAMFRMAVEEAREVESK